MSYTKKLLETVNYTLKTYLVKILGHYLQIYMIYWQKPKEKFKRAIRVARGETERYEFRFFISQKLDNITLFQNIFAPF